MPKSNVKAVFTAQEVENLIVETVKKAPQNITASLRYVSQKTGVSMHSLKYRYYGAKNTSNASVIRKTTPMFGMITSEGMIFNTKRCSQTKMLKRGPKLTTNLTKLKGLSKDSKANILDMIWGV